MHFSTELLSLLFFTHSTFFKKLFCVFKIVDATEVAMSVIPEQSCSEFKEELQEEPIHPPPPPRKPSTSCPRFSVQWNSDLVAVNLEDYDHEAAEVNSDSSSDYTDSESGETAHLQLSSRLESLKSLVKKVVHHGSSLPNLSQQSYHPKVKRRLSTICRYFYD